MTKEAEKLIVEGKKNLVYRCHECGNATYKTFCRFCLKFYYENHAQRCSRFKNPSFENDHTICKEKLAQKAKSSAPRP